MNTVLHRPTPATPATSPAARRLTFWRLEVELGGVGWATPAGTVWWTLGRLSR
jgi:hypothetical protein